MYFANEPTHSCCCSCTRPKTIFVQSRTGPVEEWHQVCNCSESLRISTSLQLHVPKSGFVYSESRAIRQRPRLKSWANGRTAFPALALGCWIPLQILGVHRELPDHDTTLPYSLMFAFKYSHKNLRCDSSPSSSCEWQQWSETSMNVFLTAWGYAKISWQKFILSDSTLWENVFQCYI